MNCFILMTFVVASVAAMVPYPQTYKGVVGGYHHSTPMMGIWDMWRDSGAQRIWAHQSVHPTTTEQTIQDQMTQTHGAIKNLQWKLNQYPQGYTGMLYPMYNKVGVADGGIHQFTDTMHYPQEKLTGHDEISQQLHDTIEVGVEAQWTADKLQKMGVPTMQGFKSEVFQTNVNQLINKHNKEEIEKQISHYQHQAQQLHEQEEFVCQQKEKIETQLAICEIQRVPLEHVQHLKMMHRQLQMQESQLIKEQLHHHLVVLQLQKLLVSKQELILNDVVHKDVTLGEQDQIFWQQH